MNEWGGTIPAILKLATVLETQTGVSSRGHSLLHTQTVSLGDSRPIWPLMPLRLLFRQWPHRCHSVFCSWANLLTGGCNQRWPRHYHFAHKEDVHTDSHMQVSSLLSQCGVYSCGVCVTVCTQCFLLLVCEGLFMCASINEQPIFYISTCRAALIAISLPMCEIC